MPGVFCSFCVGILFIDLREKEEVGGGEKCPFVVLLIDPLVDSRTCPDRSHRVMLGQYSNPLSHRPGLTVCLKAPPGPVSLSFCTMEMRKPYVSACNLS